LTRIVRGDLDWIVMKALEKDRTRRYETANGLAMDVKRYLQDEAIIARPPSKLYQFQKMARRHKGVSASAVLVLLALLLGLATSTVLLARERTERKRAELAEKAATSAANGSQHLADFLQEMLSGIDPGVARGKNTELLRIILDQTAEKAGSEFKDQPGVEAQLRATMGLTYYDLGEWDKAEAMQRQALALNQKLFGIVSTNSLASLKVLGPTLNFEEKFEEAETTLREALTLEKQLFVGNNSEVFGTLNDLGLVQWSRGNLTEAENTISRALSIGTNLVPRDLEDEKQSLMNFGLVLTEQGKYTGAEKYLQASLEERCLEEHSTMISPYLTIWASCISGRASCLKPILLSENCWERWNYCCHRPIRTWCWYSRTWPLCSARAACDWAICPPCTMPFG
jgi:tetratricopeptide (TPR) repeat protein